VKLNKTTDRKVNNVGWKYWKLHNGQPERFLFRERLPDDTETFENVSEPQFLTTAGGKATFGPTQIRWRYLDEVAYAGLLL
jgi:hypothetical protein